MKPTISILGAGSWGTALAIQASRNGHPTILWGHNSEHMNHLSVDRENKQYLPGYILPKSLKITDDLQQATVFSPVILISVPSHAFKDTLLKIKPFLQANTKIAWATKGFDPADSSLLSSIAEQTLIENTPVAALSGPTFANEVAAGLPTAITVASSLPSFSNQLSNILHNECFRIYTSQDIVGVQVGGAVKNVLAIAAGIADGLGFGANTRAALITRGLQEIIRLGTKLGGHTDTFMGLAGLGDLLLTCTDDQSRNRRFGLALGQGKNKDATAQSIGQEIEGVFAAKETYYLAKKYQIEMPIIEQTYKVLYENLPPRTAVHNLLARDQKNES